MMQSNRHYWEQQELDSMEKDLKSGNTVSAMTHKGPRTTIKDY